MIYTREQRFAGNKRVFAGIYSDDKPGKFPKKPEEIGDIKKGHLFAEMLNEQISDYSFATGSYIYVISSGERYLYNAKDKKWVKKTGSGGSGGGGDGGDISPDNIATDEDIDDMINDLDWFKD